MRPLSWVLVGAGLLVLIICAGVWNAHRVHVAERQTVLNSLLARELHISALEQQLAKQEIGFDQVVSEAGKASQRRHDSAVAGADASELLPLATEEASAVDEAHPLTDHIEDTGSAIAQAYSDIYGGAASRLQLEVAARHDSCESSLTDWDRAIGDIKDSISATLNGRFAAANDSERYYSDSDHEEVQCERHAANVLVELKKLDARLSDDVHSAKLAVRSF